MAKRTSEQAERIRREHDASYRSLFNHPDMIEHLLRRYGGLWTKNLNFSTLEPVKSRFVGQENQRRESDLIWRLKTRLPSPATQSEDWVYVYILIEFQSTPDRFMALRLLSYLCLLYEDIVRRKDLRFGKLPFVFPIVLYNGASRWKASTQVSNLIDEVPGLDRHIPNFEYLLLDETHMSDDELGELDNPVTAIFRIEQAESVEELRDLLSMLVQILSEKASIEHRRAVITWLRRVILAVKFPEISRSELRDLQEDEQMLSERIQQWISEGREEGRQEGLRTALALLIDEKFGLESSIRRRLDQAADAQLEEWTKRVLTASSLDEVFA